MIISVDTTGSIEGLQSALETVAGNDAVQGLLVLACAENGFTPELVDAILREVPVALFGGVFPQILHDKQNLTKGSIVAGFSRKIDVHIVPELSDTTLDYDQVIDRLIPTTGEATTMFVLVDGYARRSANLVESLFNIFGFELNYIGGGAGSIDPAKLDIRQVPCLFTNDGMIKDSAILALADIKSGIGVRHGWDHTVNGPFKVTESEGNVIGSLDWKPAFEVYREVVREYTGKTITVDNFFKIAKSLPFGIIKMGAERIIRDPFAVDQNDSLYFAAEITPESFVDILTGDSDSLVRAAGDARRDAEASFSGDEMKSALIMDCISRVLFLGPDFGRELNAVCTHSTPLVGALSLGEIANSGDDYMELFNKTCVVGILDD